MVFIFYIAAIIVVLSSVKVISSLDSLKALLYFVVSLLASAVIFVMLGAYFAAALEITLFVGAITLLFLSALSFLKIRRDTIENSKHGISPKVWLGPLILSFVLLVILLYGVVSTDYAAAQVANAENSDSMTEILFGPYILVFELACFLLLSALVIGYHFIYRIFSHKEKIANKEDKRDSNHA